MNSAAGFLWYNKTLFDQFGLQPPTNWEEWIAVTAALNDNGVIGFFHGAADAWVNYDMFISIANELAPGKVYQAEAGEIPWTDPDLVRAMDFWRQMFENGIMQEGALANTQYPDTHQAFTTGKAGMMLMGVWNNYAALTNAGVKEYQEGYGTTDAYEVGTIPFPDLNEDGQLGKPFGGPDVIVGINKSSTNQEAAWTVLSWMLGEESQGLHAAILNVPAIKGIPFDTSDATGDFAKQVLADQLVQLEGAAGKREFLYPEMKTALADALQNVALGDQTPEEALALVEEVSLTIER
jgi:raffinose/stachyose/melibiose transport system substrate-binding protein